MDFFAKVLQVNENTDPNGVTTSVTLAFAAQKFEEQQHGGGYVASAASFNISGKADQIAFFKANIGKQIQVSVDLTKVPVL